MNTYISKKHIFSKINRMHDIIPKRKAVIPYITNIKINIQKLISLKSCNWNIQSVLIKQYHISFLLY